MVFVSNYDQSIQGWPPQTKIPFTLEHFICVWLSFNSILAIVQPIKA